MLNTRLWLILCVGAVGVMILMSMLAHAFMPADAADVAAAGQVVLPIYFALFLVLGFSAVPLMTNVFVASLERMWAGAGVLQRPANAWAMALLQRHRVHFVLIVWGIYVAGLIIASPYILQEWKAIAR